MFSCYALLDPNDAVALLRSARSYQEAVWVAEGNPSLAWLLLVSAVETAANRWSKMRSSNPDPVAVLTDLKPDFAKRLRAAGGGEVVRIVALELESQLRSGYKFLQFLKTFWPKPPMPRPPAPVALPWTDEAAMVKILLRVYALRSRALHEAVPFPPPTCQPPYPLDPDNNGVSPIAEKSFYRWSYSKGGFWGTDNTPMLLNTFEYIVRNVLQEWWRQLCARSSAKS